MHRDLLERHAVLRVVLYLLAIILALYAGGLIWSTLLHFGDIILLFFLAWVVRFILQPFSALLERRGLPRALAVTLIYLSLLGVACGSIVLAIPLINTEIGHVAVELTSTFTAGNLAVLGERAAITLHGLGLNSRDAHALVSQASARVPAWTTALTEQAVATTTTLVGAILNLLFDAALVTMLSFYMMLDGDRLVASFVHRLPCAWHPDIHLLRRKIELSFGGFLRAQLIIAVVYGALNAAILLALGQANGLLFALLAGVLLLVPFIGPFLAVVPPALLVALQSSPSDVVRNVLIALVASVIAQQITMKLIAPNVMSAHVGLHPLLLFAALLVGAQEGGIWGALFAAPVAAVIVTMLDVFFLRFQQASHLYPDFTIEPAAPDESREPQMLTRQTTPDAVRA